MKYVIEPKPDEVVLVELTREEIQDLLGRRLLSLEADGYDILQYGRVMCGPLQHDPYLYEGDVVLYERVHAHRTNFGDPRQVVVQWEHVHGRLKEDRREGDANA